LNFLRKISCSKTCKIPPTITPILRASIEISGARRKVKTIIERLKRAVEKAGAKKCSNPFSIPPKKATRLTKKIYGNISLKSLTARLKYSPAIPGAIRLIISGAKISPSITVRIKEINKMEKNSSAKSLASLKELFNFFAKAGVKAELKAPSAKILLKRLGILKATKKASVKLVAPKKVAIVMSLRRPKTLLPNIDADTIKADLKTFLAIVGEL
jgi:hypothetical protein